MSNLNASPVEDSLELELPALVDAVPAGPVVLVLGEESDDGP
jgi:hypothetical protein